MGRTVNNGGDVLARGGVRCTFKSPDVSKEKYEEAVGGFDLQRFLRSEPKAEGPKEKTRRGNR